MADPIRVMTMTEPAPEALSADEVAFHTAVTHELRVAQRLSQFWTNHLATKYGLVAGDQIRSDGTIKRAVPEGGV